jgi:exopolyphosphatase/guanosine-5'-triphosphate,3'-diphosphate pyrophosphatase
LDARIHQTRKAGKPVGVPPLAVLDLGTNNCRLLIAAPDGRGGFRVSDSFSRIVRLGEGVGTSRLLAPAALDRTIAALKICAGRIRRSGAVRVWAIATQAARLAGNADVLVTRAREEAGLTLEVISAEQEADLAALGCAPLVGRKYAGALVFDIGGGSTEIAWVRLEGSTPSLISFVSLPFGVMTLRACTDQTCFTEEGFNTMVETVEEKLWDFEDIHRIGREINRAGVRLLGTSGTITTVASVALKLPRYRRPLVDGILLPGEEADSAVEALRAMGRKGLAAHPCIGEDRADLVLPGCAIFAAIRSVWPTPEVGVADRGLREGILLRQMRVGRRREGRRGCGASPRQSIAAAPLG